MNVKDLIIKHFEKGLLGLAVGWLLLSVIGFASKPEELSAGDRLQTTIDSIRVHASAKAAVTPVNPDWEREVKANLAASEVPAVDEFPGWLLHNRPNVVFKWATIAVEQEPLHVAPKDLSLRPERGKITITWTPSDDNALVIVTKYEIMRRDGEKGKYKVLRELPGDAKEFEDGTVSPRDKYWYKVVSHADLDKEHPVVRKLLSRGALKEIKKELRVMESEESGPVKTPRIIIVVPTTVTLATDEETLKAAKENKDAPAKADLKIFKWAPEEKAGWITHTFRNILEGQAIGGIEKKGKKDVDFTVGGILKKAEIVKRPHPTIKGQEVSAFIIEIEYPDKSTETFNSFEKPDEIKDVK